ncbi:phage holin family protein [Luteolibacter pohnpeiensis]|uniref:Phage holin family protein n=1 Tax=Luteolibacter pohnpeiensis TaxID=454153 RepID=A0A934VW75_9BACT|nr:phage holin family protein [Luteolibacter pohnpeiensis]
MVAARLTIMKIEGKKAAESGIKRVIFAASAAILILLAWILFVAGAVSAIAIKTHVDWCWIALAAGGIHLIIAFIFLACAKKAGGEAFPITRAELKKDREWIAKCQNNKTSSN